MQVDHIRRQGRLFGRKAALVAEVAVEVLPALTAILALAPILAVPVRPVAAVAVTPVLLAFGTVAARRLPTTV
ncbi:MAG: hypothetical protein C0426_01375, partial [Rhodobacter sp.]|nr:hypothetical protein [Rhodobacter sp.]